MPFSTQLSGVSATDYQAVIIEATVPEATMADEFLIN